MNRHAQTHRADPQILGRRTLQQDHRILAEFLRPGRSVLDVGCGTGAITAGIATAVGPSGAVVGVDRDEEHLQTAAAAHAGLAGLRFERADATRLPFRAQFDIVTAARTLQWISDPLLAVSQMSAAAKPSGMVVVLDYNHVGNTWDPEPPIEFRTFYEGFLAWRQANHWDNQMADHLPELFRSAGLIDVQSHPQNEVAERGEADFEPRSALWCGVIDYVGEQIAQAGWLEPAQVRSAGKVYGQWVQNDLRRQTLKLRAVVGRVP